MHLLEFTHPDAVAIDDGQRCPSFAEVERRSERLAAVLRDTLGLSVDEHIALLAHNGTSGFELVLGAMLSGLWITPINWHLADEEIAYVLEDSGAKVVFVDASQRSRVPATFAGRVVDVGEELEGLLSEATPRPLDPEAPPGGAMIYTSGTSGRPKGVRRSRPATLRDALAAWREGGRSFGFDGRGPHLVTGPLYHAAPLLFAIYDLLNGSPVVILRRWDEREFLRVVTEKRVRHTHLVPTMMVRLLRLPADERAAFDASGLELVMHGAAPIRPETKRSMIDWWGPRLVEYWGATEGGVYTLISSEDWLTHPGSVGKALGTFEIFAIDDEGRRLGPDEEGTLVCRHTKVARPFVYHHDEAKTDSAYVAPGVFTVGDLGWVDENGFVFLGERRSNLILSGGVNIYPAEVERVLSGHPAVADVAVFGIPDPEWGEKVHAAIELREGLSPTDELSRDILDHARAHLAGFKLPRGIDFHARLPRTEAGKMFVRRLREPYWR